MSSGHLVGDEVIRAVSRLMVEHLGDIGRVGRLGGEEFAFLASAMPMSLLAARMRAFRASVEAVKTEHDGMRVSVTVSGGVAERCEGQSFETLYVAADRALYAAKGSGRNRILIDEAGTHRDIDHLRDGFPRAA